MAIGSEVVTGCVVDTEQIAESTGSTSQVWSTNSGTQPLTISCGFPAPYLAIAPGAPDTFYGPHSAFGPNAGGMIDRGQGDVLSKTMLRVLPVLRLNVDV